jgi:uncharacterized protein (DUF1697 family)
VVRKETIMVAYAALLRAVNVMGTGKLPMPELKKMCEAAGFQSVKTYIASGNVVFTSTKPEKQVKAAVERAVAAYTGRAVGVLIRTAEEMAAVAAANPFADKPGDRVVAIFLGQAPPQDALEFRSKHNGEQIVLGTREFYVYYPMGIGESRLKIPAAKDGTMRNMNTIAKLAEMAAALRP